MLTPPRHGRNDDDASPFDCGVQCGLMLAATFAASAELLSQAAREQFASGFCTALFALVRSAVGHDAAAAIMRSLAHVPARAPEVH